MRGALRSFALVVALAAAFYSCTKPSPVRIGVNSWPPCELWYIARDKGLLDGLEIEIVRFSAWTDNMKALALGNVDVTHSTYFNALYYFDKGKRGKIMLKSDTIEGGDGLVVKSGLEGLASLEGKRIAVEASTLFAKGSVDACFTYEPFLSAAASKGRGKITYTTRDMPDTMIDCLVAEACFLEKRPKDARKLVDGYLAAQAWVIAHKEDAYRIMAANEGMSPADFGPFYEGFTFFGKSENAANFDSDRFSRTLVEMNAFLSGHGFVKPGLDPKDVVYSGAVGK